MASTASDEFEKFQGVSAACRANRELCPYGCNRLIARRTIDYHRNHGCRSSLAEPFGDFQRRRNFICGACFQEFPTRVSFFDHLSEAHEVHAKRHQMVFSTHELFDRFVKWLECEGGAHFRIKSGSRTRGSGKTIFLACNRSGFVSGPNLTGNAARDRVGPVRIGFSCTAYISGVMHSDGSVRVEYCGDHYGHDARMRLPSSVRQLIMTKQAEGADNAEVLAFLQSHFIPMSAESIIAQRICLVDMDELRQVASQARRWRRAGTLPAHEKTGLWEEEFFIKAGLDPSKYFNVRRRSDDKTTDQYAMELDWQRPITWNPTNVVDVNGDMVDDEGAEEAGHQVEMLHHHHHAHMDHEGEGETGGMVEAEGVDEDTLVIQQHPRLGVQVRKATEEDLAAYEYYDELDEELFEEQLPSGVKGGQMQDHDELINVDELEGAEQMHSKQLQMQPIVASILTELENIRSITENVDLTPLTCGQMSTALQRVRYLRHSMQSGTLPAIASGRKRAANSVGGAVEPHHAEMEEVLLQQVGDELFEVNEVSGRVVMPGVTARGRIPRVEIPFRRHFPFKMKRMKMLDAMERVSTIGEADDVSDDEELMATTSTGLEFKQDIWN